MSDIVLKNPLKESKNSFVYLIKIDDYKCSEGHWQADPTSSMYGWWWLVVGGWWIVDGRKKSYQISLKILPDEVQVIQNYFDFENS